MDGQTLHASAKRFALKLPFTDTAGLSARSMMCLKSVEKYSCFSLNITAARW